MRSMFGAGRTALLLSALSFAPPTTAQFVGPIPDPVIFVDGFESGSLVPWMPVSVPGFRSCAEIRADDPTAPDGAYWIDPDGEGAGSVPPFVVHCDMTVDEGGWTLVAEVHRSHGQGADEPDDWFQRLRDEAALRDAFVEVDRVPGQASHGQARIAALAAISNLARFRVVAENDPEQGATWFKVADAGLPHWFSPVAHEATTVCSDLAMTLDCSEGKIGPGGDLWPDVVTLDGMNLVAAGYLAGGPLHMRLNGSLDPSFDAVCSYTSDYDGNAWNDTNQDHWGNGLQVWVNDYRVGAPQLTLVKTATPAVFSVGIPASYTLRLDNTGTGATTASATIVDEIPPGLVPGPSPPGCGASGLTVTCTASAGLAAGSGTEFVIPITVTPSAPAHVSNSATVGGGGDPDCPGAARCTDTVGRTVNRPQLTLTKSASASSWTVGVAASYTLTLQNTGTAATNDQAMITDTIPTGLVIGPLPEGCSVVGQTVNCTVAAGLFPGASHVFAIPVTPTQPASPGVMNSATAYGGGDATCPAASRCTGSVGPIPIGPG